MQENETLEMISAFVLGCMDKENFDLFKEYFEKQGNIHDKKFGEFQNIASLIPTLLDISEPDAKLKDAVAKNVLSYQEEIKAKIRASKTATIYANKKNQQKNDLESSQVNNAAKKPGSPIIEQNSKTNGNTSLEEAKQINNQEGKNFFKNQKPLTLEAYGESLKTQLTNSSKIPWLIFISILVVTIFISGYFIFENNNLNSKISLLNREITSLKADLRKEFEYVKSNKKVLDFLNNNNEVDIINFQPRDNSMDASGKLFISFNKKKALLSAENLPILSPGKIFQLWMITKNISYPLLKFETAHGKKYYSMPAIPYVPKSEVDLIRITVEPDSGSEYPTGTTILFGGFSK